MRESRLRELERQLHAWRRSPKGVDRERVLRVARKLGRTEFNSGKEPTFVNERFNWLRPVSIPGHRGDLAPGTLRNIVDSLMNDVEEWQNCIDAGLVDSDDQTDD